jgi:hypothetical protein
VGAVTRKGRTRRSQSGSESSRGLTSDRDQREFELELELKVIIRVRKGSVQERCRFKKRVERLKEPGMHRKPGVLGLFLKVGARVLELERDRTRLPPKSLRAHRALTSTRFPCA